MAELPKEIHAKMQEWLSDPFDQETKKEVQALLSKDKARAIDAFYKTITFGTGGMRGIMGVGTNRVNRYTIRFATQGLSNYILSQNPSHPKVFIGYDSRRNSREFAEETARVLAGNSIQVFITKEIRPTPFVSFGCRHHKCTAGVMITASHNAPEYNGYKVYWSDGAQVVSPHDVGIIAEVEKITHPDAVQLAPLEHPLIQTVEQEEDEAYFKALTPLQNHPKTNQKEGSLLQIIYSPLHGCGITTLPQALKRWGFTSISFVESQKLPDKDFPAAYHPNPEQEKTLQPGIDQLLAEKKDLFIATDPDADRMGVVVRHQGKGIILSGNQIASLCLYYLCTNKSLPQNSGVVTTIVTTPLFHLIAKSYNVASFEVLTGFKYIGEKIHEWEQTQEHAFLFGAEESLGFLYGTHSRDKDATIAACLFAEMTLQLKKKGKTPIDLLNEIYKIYGPFSEKQLSIPFGEGKAGMEKMDALMEALRKSPPETIYGQKVIEVIDYLLDPTTLPKSNVLLFKLDDQSKFVIRPSGTEPKIKIYGLACYNEKGKLDASLKSLKHLLLNATI